MYLTIKRIFDIVSSLLVLTTLLPLFVVIALWIILDSKGGLFYKQIRVGKDNQEFGLYKFRSMAPNSDKKSQITIGNDRRITKAGKFIRKYKIDEFPQLLNIIIGDMSIVGPRPEVPKYVKMYTHEQLKVLSVKPGLTDYASVRFFDEQKILGMAADPERKYIKEIMPLKLRLNLIYIEDQNMLIDLKIIFNTIAKIFR